MANTKKAKADTNTKSAKAKNVKTSTRVEDILSISGAIKTGKRSKALQIKLEKMQLDVLNKKTKVSNSVGRALREMNAAKKREADFKALKKKPVSNYDELHELFNNHLLGRALTDLSETAELNATEFITKQKGAAISEEQQEIISEYYLLQAELDIQQIESIRAFLELKGYEVPEATSGTTKVKLVVSS